VDNVEKDAIEFFAKFGDWVCIKKVEIKPDTTGPEITRILTSIQNSIDRKKWDFLGKAIDLGSLDAIAAEIVGEKGRVNGDRLSEILAKLNGPGVGKKINELVKGKAAAEVAKTYVTRAVFELLNFRVDMDAKLIEKFVDEQEKAKLSQ
jgi:hypothetical protein